MSNQHNNGKPNNGNQSAAVQTSDKTGDVLMITNLQRRRYTLPANAQFGVTQARSIDAGDTQPVPAAYWDALYAGGKNKVLAALVNGNYLQVRKPEEARRDGQRLPELQNPPSPETPEQLKEAPEGVQRTNTRSKKGPKLQVSDAE